MPNEALSREGRVKQSGNTRKIVSAPFFGAEIFLFRF